MQRLCLPKQVTETSMTQSGQGKLFFSIWGPKFSQGIDAFCPSTFTKTTV